MCNFTLSGRVLACLVPLLFLFACSNAEETAQGEYTRIVAIEQAGDIDQALALYRQLVRESPQNLGGGKLVFG